MKLSKVCKGRVGIYVPDHPRANNRGYVPRARHVMEQYLGRYLDTNEIVHHCNRNKLDDSIENLELIYKKEHDRLHYSEKFKKLDYGAIKELRAEGYGYKRIAKVLNYKLSSVKSAVRKIEFGTFTPWK